MNDASDPGRPAGESRAATEQASSFDRWLDAFFAAFYRQRPVDATAIGVHDYDGRLPDFSATGVADRLSTAETLLGELSRLPVASLDETRLMDMRLARGVLEMQRWELASSHSYQHDPTVYTGAAAFGLLSLLRYPTRPLEERLEHLRERLLAVPRLFEAARANLSDAPSAWIDRAMADCRGSLALLSDGIADYLDEHGLDRGTLAGPSTVAAAACAELSSFLEHLPRRDATAYACGRDALAMLYREAHALDETPEEAEALAWTRLEEGRAQLADALRACSVNDSHEALALLAARHPPIAGYLERHQEVFSGHQELSDRLGLVTWPPFPVRFVATPTWLDEASRHITVYPYHAPPAFDEVSPIDFLAGVLPLDDLDEAERFLAQRNDSVIKLNHVVHHAGLGHHVQNWYAYHRSPSRVGRIAAVDSAGRTVMLCGATMAEGWASYAVALMEEAGFVDPLERCSLRLGEIRAAARVIVDTRLHGSRWTFDEAVSFLEEEAMMSAAGAHGEVTRISMQPGIGSAYLMGVELIGRLRTRWQAANDAESPDLRPFHDRLLSYGSIPVAMVGRAMFPPSLED